MTKVGEYKLGPTIGEGGNADVYQAVSPDGDDVAVKLLRTKNQTSEPWHRFQAEISILEKLRGTPGVMPVLSSSRRPPRMWYAMPLAVPLKEALRESTLDGIVSVFADLAGTLVRLAAQGVHHRDIKPENIFRLPSGEYVIGDFGIHKGPVEQSITPDGKRVGPALYAAQEMLSYRRGDDHSRADVYSLAKSLWVVATGQNLPLQGQHPVDFPGAWIGSFRNDGDTLALDWIIVKANALAAADRLTMAEFAKELRAWLAPPIVSATHARLDLSAMAGTVRHAKSAASLRASRLQQVSAEVTKNVEEGSKLLSPVSEAFATLGPDIVVNQSFSGNSLDHIGHLLRHLPEGLHGNGEVYGTYCFLISTFTTSDIYLQTFFGGFAVADQIHFAAGHALVEYDRRGVRVRDRVIFDRAEAVRSGSLCAPEVIRRLAHDVLARVREAAEIYTARLGEMVRAQTSV